VLEGVRIARFDADGVAGGAVLVLPRVVDELAGEVDGVALAGLREALGEAPPGGDVEVVDLAVLVDGDAGVHVRVAVLGGLEPRFVREAADERDVVLAAREELDAVLGGDGVHVAGEEADAVGDDADDVAIFAGFGGVPELLEAAVRDGGLPFLEGGAEAGGVRADDADVVAVGAGDGLAVLAGVLDAAVEAELEDGRVAGAVLEVEAVDDAGEGDGGLLVHGRLLGGWARGARASFFSPSLLAPRASFPGRSGLLWARRWPGCLVSVGVGVGFVLV